MSTRPALLNEMTDKAREDLCRVIAFSIKKSEAEVAALFAQNMDKVAFLMPQPDGTFEVGFEDLDVWQQKLFEALDKVVEENDGRIPGMVTSPVSPNGDE